jgi:hypothetical protein
LEDFMDRMLDLTPEQADAVERQDFVRVKGRCGVCVIVREETL